MLTPSLAPGLETAEQLVAEAERLLRLGEPLLAYNVADSGLQRWPEQLRLRQLLGLALARSGDLERANRVLHELASAGVDDAETLGLLARTHKDLGMRTRDAGQRERHLASANRIYAEAFARARQRGALEGAFYTGINAATVAVLRGELDDARWLAADVLEICEALGDCGSGAETEYWRRATMGEAALILGDAPAAAGHYAAAMGLAPGRFGDLSTTRRQARLLASHLQLDSDWMAQALHIPPVLVFTGHAVDRAGRSGPRLPPDIEPTVRAAIRRSLASAGPLAVYGSAACGADLLCLELARELGAETHVVLPFPPEELRRTSVEIAPGGWGERFDRMLAAADSVTVASDHRASGSVATFEYANLVMTGLGRLRAQLLDTDLRGLAIREPGSTGAPGGSGSIVSVWKQRGIAIDHVDLEAAIPGERRLPITCGAAASKTASEPEPGPARHEIKALLFADAVGYSKLTEDQIPRYVHGFLGAVADLNRRTRYRHEHAETAGDGLYMVFAEAIDAAQYAIELSALVARTDWTAHGLPAEFGLRIALHCGPVYCGWDPVTGSRLFTGPHTSRAARIEPITPPGQVYASSAFAAVAAARGDAGLVMRHVGRIPLAKRAGSLSLYHLQPAACADGARPVLDIAQEREHTVDDDADQLEGQHQQPQ